MTFLAMQNAVYRLMRDPSKTKFDLQSIKDRLNEAEEQYCQLTNYVIKKDTSISTVVGQQEYALEADYKSIDGVFYNGWRLYHSKMLDTIFPTPMNSTPYMYYVRETNLGLHPIPTAIGTLTIVYRSTAGQMAADTDQPQIPQEDHSLLLFSACYMCCLEADDTRGGAFLKNWTDGLGQAIRSDTLKAFERTPVVGEIEAIPTPYNHDVEGVLWP